MSDTSIEQLMPPKFLADDPDFVDLRVHSRVQSRLLLPDGKGGVTSLDRNIVRIEHQGQRIELFALTPDQKRKRQWLINLISIVLGILFLVLLFSLL